MDIYSLTNEIQEIKNSQEEIKELIQKLIKLQKEKLEPKKNCNCLRENYTDNLRDRNCYRMGR